MARRAAVQQEQRDINFEIWSAIFEAEAKLELIHSLLGEVIEDIEDSDVPQVWEHRKKIHGDLLHIVFDGICYAEDMLERADDLDQELKRREVQQA